MHGCNIHISLRHRNDPCLVNIYSSDFFSVSNILLQIIYTWNYVCVFKKCEIARFLREKCCLFIQHIQYRPSQCKYPDIVLINKQNTGLRLETCKLSFMFIWSELTLQKTAHPFFYKLARNNLGRTCSIHFDFQKMIKIKPEPLLPPVSFPFTFSQVEMKFSPMQSQCQSPVQNVAI